MDNDNNDLTDKLSCIFNMNNDNNDLTDKLSCIFSMYEVTIFFNRINTITTEYIDRNTLSKSLKTDEHYIVNFFNELVLPNINQNNEIYDTRTNYDTLFIFAKCTILFDNLFAFKYFVTLGNIDPTSDGQLFLKIAVYQRSFKIINYLLDNGSNISIDADNLIVLFFDRITNNSSNTSLNKNLLQLLIDNGANIHIDNNYPLRECIQNRNYAILKILIENGIDITYDDNLILKTFLLNDLDDVKYLLDCGADINSLRTNNLINLIINEKIDTIKLLIQYGLDFTIINNYVSAPEDAANDSNTVAITKMLIELGIDPIMVIVLINNKLKKFVAQFN